ncbi:hypothetical protein GWK08_17620 [Leptobacterium flavescens]|uniref:Uncharacterized protein n=1 Tax=Leptobacterium flavescens TaxID=472055 RepID=A0A6P0UTW4_9FLAO|nr:hypothetical protein [Leptobacterium flavescens]NER15279.1 hypothetical protein [Leptobacterium flavescens]
MTSLKILLVLINILSRIGKYFAGISFSAALILFLLYGKDQEALNQRTTLYGLIAVILINLLIWLLVFLCSVVFSQLSKSYKLFKSVHH